LGSWLTYDAWAGQNFLGYRYPFPLTVLAAAMVVRPRNRIASAVFDIAIAWSVAIGIVGARLIFTLSPTRLPWSLGVPVAETFAVFACVLALVIYYRIRIEPELARRWPAREEVAVL